MITEITFPGYVPGNNGPKGLLRMHHRKKADLKEKYWGHIRSLTRNRHPGQVRLELIRYGCGQEPDYDNLVSTGKLLLDAFKLAKVIVDDKPAIIAERDYRWERVKLSHFQKTVVRFTCLP
ncbi:hypothetical protein A6C57_01310 [Fibrella sp. ES10-3-2-2]